MVNISFVCKLDDVFLLCGQRWWEWFAMSKFSNLVAVSRTQPLGVSPDRASVLVSMMLNAVHREFGVTMSSWAIPLFFFVSS